MGKSNLKLIPFLLLISGCASGPKLGIQSDVPARIELNGIEVCETPCIVTGSYRMDGYGIGCIGGADSRLEAYPIDPSNGFKQSKIVYGDCNQKLDVYFDMSSGGAVNTLVHNSPMNPNSGSSIKDKLTELANLKKSGLITESEYKIKRKQILDTFK